MRPIAEIAEAMGLDAQAIIPYGHYKAKIPLEAIRTDGPKGKLVVVTGITPTPAGEGKTTTTVGLAQGLGRLGKRVIATLREPALGPIFGIKGGGTGGGKATVLPEDEINVHFTGDAHAVGTGAQPACSIHRQRGAAAPSGRARPQRRHLAPSKRRRRPRPAPGGHRLGRFRQRSIAGDGIRHRHRLGNHGDFGVSIRPR